MECKNTIAAVAVAVVLVAAAVVVTEVAIIRVIHTGKIFFTESMTSNLNICQSKQ